MSDDQKPKRGRRSGRGRTTSIALSNDSWGLLHDAALGRAKQTTGQVSVSACLDELIKLPENVATLRKWAGVYASPPAKKLRGGKD